MTDVSDGYTPEPDQHLDPIVASTYDERVADRFHPDELEPTVDLLADLADGGPVLELAIGTGRVALPLAQRGIEVHGIDQSEPMLAELRSKPGGTDLPIHVGDMTTTDTGHTYRLVVLVFNTLGNLTTQQSQLDCFANAARHLDPGGRFVIEIGVPRIASLPPGETVLPFAHSDTYLGFDDFHDAVNQRFTSNHWHLHGGTDGRPATVKGTFRWVWPSELDLMARLAGMTLEARWGDWKRGPFTNDSQRHISVWRRPA